MKVYQRLAAAFAAEGTDHLFGMMGDGNMWWMDALDNHGVKMLEVRHEGVGLGMADGYARYSRKVGVATATCGPGVTQLATAFVTAARAGSPVVAFCGESPTGDEEYSQRYEQAPFALACESGYVRINTPETTDECVRRAFYMAKTQNRPVMLAAPMDVQQMKFPNDDEPYQPSSTLFRKIVTNPDMVALKEAADLIQKSKHPVLLLGRGAMWSGAGDIAMQLADRIGAVIATTLRTKNWLIDKEAYHCGISGNFSTKTAMQLFEEADVVIGVGASLNRFTLESGYLYGNAKYIHMDTKQHVLMAGGRGADIYIQADAKSGLEALDAMLSDRKHKNTGFRTPDVKKKLAHQFEDRTEFEIEPGAVDPRLVCTTLDEMIPQTVPLFMGSGASAGFTGMGFTRARPAVHAGYFFGCIGQMFPAAMGAIAANDYKPALLVDGDASSMMHLADFDTAVRYKMPLLMVVLNDQALGSEWHKMKAKEMKYELSGIATPNLGKVAEAFGGRGAMVTNVEDLKKAAADWVKNPGPMIIDARISRNVLTLHNRRILYGRDE